MDRKAKFLELWKQTMLPLAFTFSSLLNFGFYYLGLAFVENAGRQYGYILINVLFAILAGLTFLYLLRKERFKWYIWLLWCLVMLFFAISFAVWLLASGPSSQLFSHLQRFIVFCLPAFFIGICAARWHTEKYLVSILENLSFFAFPAALAYFCQVLFNSNPFNYGRDLGMISYMSFAYTLMPLLLAQIIQFSDQAELEIPLIRKKLRHPQVVRGVMISIFWIAIYSSGTRGTMVCVICFCALLLLYKLLHRAPIKRAGLISLIMVALILFNLMVYAPPGMRWLQRINQFLYGLSQGEIVTGVEDPSVQDRLDELVAADPAVTDPVATDPVATDPGTTDPVATDPVATDPGTTDPVATDPVATDPGTTDPVATDPGTTDPEEPIKIGNRGTMYKLALKEFLKSPLTGMGPGGFTVKYGFYPHNVPLELLAETGLAGTIPMLCLILFAAWNLLVRGWRDQYAQYLLLFIAAYAVRANISGSLWECSALLLALGYGLTYRPSKTLETIAKKPFSKINYEAGDPRRLR